MSERDEPRIKDVACPRCGAMRGMPCRNTSRRATAPHRGRIMRLRKLRDAWKAEHAKLAQWTARPSDQPLPEPGNER